MNAPILAILAVVSWGILFPEPIENGLHIPLWYVVLALAWIATFFLVWGSIVAFNRPRFLVPPRFRSKLGAFAEWGRRSGGRRSGAP